MSASPHRIRLRAPWLSRPSTTPAGAPCSSYSRRFGRPTGIGASDTIWLAIELDSTELPAGGAIMLNGQPLAWRDGPRWEVSARLAARNELTIEWPEPGPSDSATVSTLAGVATPQVPGELPPAIREVRLEIFAGTPA